MWAHYANQFRGLCIAYHLPRLLKSLDDDVNFVRIFYNESVPLIGKTDKSTDELARKILSYKNYRWLYEREWRMFAPQGKAFYQDRTCVTHVYFGSRMDPVDMETISRKLDELEIKWSAMSVKKYSISFDEC